MAEPKKTTKQEGAEPATTPEVTKALEQILKRMETLEEQNKEKDEKIEMLLEVADNARKENYGKKKGKKKITPIVKLSTIDTRIVVAWKTVMDEVYRDDAGVWHEKQVHDYVTVDALDENGEEKTFTFNLVELIQKKKIVKIDAEIVKREVVHKDEETGDEQVNFHLKVVETGRLITVDGKFVN